MYPKIDNKGIEKPMRCKTLKTVQEFNWSKK